mgnify:CR=1 FL=1
MLDNARFALLMARFAGDEKLGKEATSAFFDVMTVLNKAYDDGSLNSILESKTTYLSALVEARSWQAATARSAILQTVPSRFIRNC